MALLRRYGWLLVLAALAVLLVFALSTLRRTPTAEAPGPGTAGEALATAAATGVPPEAEETFQNPIFRQDFPDPGLIEVDGIYYAYATNASGRNIQMARSTDLVKWELLRDALPALPTWARLGGSFIWAPEVIQIDDSFVMYVTARDKEADLQCIGVAVATGPEGPFQSAADEPLICQVEEGGSIDASPFRDEDGTLYLYWKNDGNCCNITTYLYVQEMAPDGLSLVGEPVRLVRNDSAWEGDLVEAPTMWRQDGGYYLFFSANSYGGVDYAVGYAFCESATGPCEDSPDNPILASTPASEGRPAVIGPGHQTIIMDDDGETWMVYHAWEVTPSGTKGTRRFMWMDPLVWEDGVPDIIGPTVGPQPLP